MDKFELVSEFKPSGDQPSAIRQITHGFRNGTPQQTLLGVTGSGKTFTMAHVIASLNRPTLILSHNKTLAAQLYREFKDLFPENAVEYFVSYYDYYQPEAYIPRSDTYIEKDCAINEELDRVRLSAMRSLLERRDVIVVASVSCIYGIGSPEEYHGMTLLLNPGDRISREEMVRKLIEIQYDRNDMDFARGTFRVRGDTVDIYRAHEDKKALRVEFFGDEIDGLYEIDALKGTRLRPLQRAAVHPATPYTVQRPRMEAALQGIRDELAERLDVLRNENRLVEAQRLEQRTRYDLEMMMETGHCQSIENYSRHFDGRAPGTPPYTLIDYFPQDYLLFIDESHASLPQVRAMYHGDRARKQNLIEHGFRLPSALDNRPLTFDEFESKQNQVLYVSATPNDYELDKSNHVIIEQLVRPTGLLDPIIEVRPAETQVDNLLEEVRVRVERNERVLVTTLTKRMAEDLTRYYQEVGIRVRYLHSDIDTIERTEIIRDLRAGEFDVLVGVNLLREGLDLPEVSLVGVLDADKEGFLRDKISLTQICGRAARHLDGRVIMYADKMTRSMEFVIHEVTRRRERQQEYNEKHNITPRGIRKNIGQILDTISEKDYADVPRVAEKDSVHYHTRKELEKAIGRVKVAMQKAAQDLDFEGAASLRDEMFELEKQAMEIM
ncbi:TPA: excinuclease ABC subunit B [Candidatus Sumerlaeota bacterium]|nr:excinuclease ABC subunit B [Candidatus Sumerlaeota bacterium]